jgi:hypothetical protein
MIEDGIAKCRAGVTTIDEVFRVTASLSETDAAFRQCAVSPANRRRRGRSADAREVRLSILSHMDTEVAATGRRAAARLPVRRHDLAK